MLSGESDTPRGVLVEQSDTFLGARSGTQRYWYRLPFGLGYLLVEIDEQHQVRVQRVAAATIRAAGEVFASIIDAAQGKS